MKRTVDSLNGGPAVTLTPGTVAGQVLVSVGEDAAYLYSVDLLLGEVLWVTGYQRGEVLRRQRTVIPVEVVPGLTIEIPTDLLADLTDDERVECIEAARREVERRATTMRIWRSRQAEHEETRRRHRPVIEAARACGDLPDDDEDTEP